MINIQIIVLLDFLIKIAAVTSHLVTSKYGKITLFKLTSVSTECKTVLETFHFFYCDIKVLWKQLQLIGMPEFLSLF